MPLGYIFLFNFLILCPSLLSLAKPDPATPPRGPFHLQIASTYTIADAKFLRTGAWYDCPLRGSASIIGLRLGTPVEELGEGLKDLKGMATP